ncbi:transcription termination factor, mitochondrial [Athalia rosae]|uniref:transcription termination factor, mitochondrial n=1 Tax=Athalia rosae TaxID=37344 RepID=UPI002033ACEA|nr:transcription termination factor, mitochondrial [Athalia rosae]
MLRTAEIMLAFIRDRRWLVGKCQRVFREYRRYSTVDCSLNNRIISRHWTLSDFCRGINLICYVRAVASLPLSIEVRSPSEVTRSTPKSETFSLPTEIPDASSRRHYENRIIKIGEVTHVLQQLVGIHHEEADHIIKAHPLFITIDLADISRNYHACIDAGLSKTTIQKNPGLLAYPHFLLRNNIRLIRSMKMTDINDTVPLFFMAPTTLRLLCVRISSENIDCIEPNRIEYLAKQLECPMIDVYKLFAERHFMHTISFAKLCRVLKILLDCHVTRTDILRDAWAFKYNPEAIAKRLHRVKDSGVFPIKPWMIRCTEAAVKRLIHKEQQRRILLGDDMTIIENLSLQFKCNKNYMSDIFAKYPELASMNILNLQQLADFVLKNGYSLEHVQRVPQILVQQLGTVQKRFDVLVHYGHKPNSLRILCENTQLFDAYLIRVKVRRLLSGK